MKYPIGTQTFSTLIEEGMVYVDKTDLVYQLVQKRICFFCRPRRFGKSLLISTLDSYFKGRKELFKGLKIEALETEWKQYPVFRIDFAQGGFENPEGLKDTLSSYLDEWEAQYGIENKYDKFGLRFAKILSEAHKSTGQKAVVLVDEYDKPMLDVLMEPMEEQNRLVLKEFYGTFKVADEHLRFVLLTGVTKFSQVSVFSGFNQPEDVSMDSGFDTLCGITQEELVEYFDGEIETMAAKHKCSKKEMYQRLKRQYDGYHFSEEMIDIFNPFSLLNAMSRKNIDDYWFASGTPTYLMKLIDRSKTNIQEIVGRMYDKSYFMDYKADVEDPLAMIYQSGYLTIKGYNSKRGQYQLDFPNNEVRNGFLTLLANNYCERRNDPKNFVLDINDMLDECRLDDMRDALTGFFANIPYNANYQERAWSYESHYHYTLYLIFKLLSCYTILTEKQNSRGRADIVVETADYIYIFEFKLDGTAAEALKQIVDSGYAEPYAGDNRKLFRIGVSFSSEKKNIIEWEVV